MARKNISEEFLNSGGSQVSSMMTLVRLEAAGMRDTDLAASDDPDLRALGECVQQAVQRGEKAFRDTGISRAVIRKLALGD